MISQVDLRWSNTKKCPQVKISGPDRKKCLRTTFSQVGDATLTNGSRTAQIDRIGSRDPIRAVRDRLRALFRPGMGTFLAKSPHAKVRGISGLLDPKFDRVRIGQNQESELSDFFGSRFSKFWRFPENFTISSLSSLSSISWKSWFFWSFFLIKKCHFFGHFFHF